MAREFDHLFKLLIIGDSGEYLAVGEAWRSAAGAPNPTAPAIIGVSLLLQVSGRAVCSCDSPITRSPVVTLRR